MKKNIFKHMSVIALAAMIGVGATTAYAFAPGQLVKVPCTESGGDGYTATLNPGVWNRILGSSSEFILSRPSALVVNFGAFFPQIHNPGGGVLKDTKCSLNLQDVYSFCITQWDFKNQSNSYAKMVDQGVRCGKTRIMDGTKTLGHESLGSIDFIRSNGFSPDSSDNEMNYYLKDKVVTISEKQITNKFSLHTNLYAQCLIDDTTTNPVILECGQPQGSGKK